MNLPYWQGKVKNMVGQDKSMICLTLVHPDGTIAACAAKAGIHMFGAMCTVIVMGDEPVVCQCSHCHLLGHNMSGCWLKAGTIKCYICGGAHLVQAHGAHCKDEHTIPGVCCCKYKCLLCGKLGHHACTCSCPKWGHIDPPPLESPGGPVLPPAPPMVPPTPVLMPPVPPSALSTSAPTPMNT